MPWDWVSQALNIHHDQTTQTKTARWAKRKHERTSSYLSLRNSRRAERQAGSCWQSRPPETAGLLVRHREWSQRLQACRPGFRDAYTLFCVLRCVQRTAQRLTMKRNIYRLFKSQQMVVTRRNEFQQIFLTLSSGTDLLGGFPQRGMGWSNSQMFWNSKWAKGVILLWEITEKYWQIKKQNVKLLIL